MSKPASSLAKLIEEMVSPLFTDAQSTIIVERGDYHLLVFLERQWAIHVATLVHDGKLEAVEDYDLTKHFRLVADLMFTDPRQVTHEIIAPWIRLDFDKNQLQTLPS